MTDVIEVADIRQAERDIQKLIKRASWLLDTEEFGQWLETFAPEGRYEIVVFAPEVRRQTCWWRATTSELLHIFKEMPNHVREDAKRAHLVTDISIELNGRGVSALSRFAVFKTNQQGESSVYAVGRYEDELSNESGDWKFVKRTVVLDTRMFDVFPHMAPL